MLAVPIFHVNGEVPRDVAAVTRMALDYRQRFQRDVVIDMLCYRKHGHNEGDEPSFTQPHMYEVIRNKPNPREVYAQHLIKIGTLTETDVQQIYGASFEAMQRAAERATPVPGERSVVDMKSGDPDESTYSRPTDGPSDTTDPTVHKAAMMRITWSRYLAGSLHDQVDTTFDKARLVELLRAANTVPEGFTAHAKIRRLFKQRQQVVDGERPVDWAVGEQAAFVSLLDQGIGVRLSGQDSGRGTFSHRHAVITDIQTGHEIFPLAELDYRRVSPSARSENHGAGNPEVAQFRVLDSSLSELAVLGFEVGFAFDTPEQLVMWEAQFGDFANGAQVIIDQYLASSEQKWNRFCGLVLLLPHGYEGQGPEHSSARLERFLQLCAEENMQVVNITTPANFYHLLRRQMLRNVRKPLIVMTPKSLLRHPRSDLHPRGARELVQFQSVIDDADHDAQAPSDRVVQRQGLLRAARVIEARTMASDDVACGSGRGALPVPGGSRCRTDSRAASRRPTGRVVPRGAQEHGRLVPTGFRCGWSAFQRARGLRRYVGRKAAASPATGSHQLHLTRTVHARRTRRSPSERSPGFRSLAMVDVTIPQIGESITTVFIARWIRKPGEAVAAGDRDCGARLRQGLDGGSLPVVRAWSPRPWPKRATRSRSEASSRASTRPPKRVRHRSKRLCRASRPSRRRSPERSRAIGTRCAPVRPHVSKPASQGVALDGVSGTGPRGRVTSWGRPMTGARSSLQSVNQPVGAAHAGSPPSVAR